MITIVPLLLLVLLQVDACVKTVPTTMPATKTSATTTTTVCKSGYTLCASSGFCFKVVENTAGIDQANAEAACIADGGNLASIHSDGEADCVQALITSTNVQSGCPSPTMYACQGQLTAAAMGINCGVWIGLVTQSTTMGTNNPDLFKWLDGTEYILNDFYPGPNPPEIGQPDNGCVAAPDGGQSLCVAIGLPFNDMSSTGNSQWDDNQCSSTLVGYVCKQATTTVTSTSR